LNLSQYLITDPGFYLLAIPAVLILSMSKTGLGSGFGSLATPLLGMAIAVPQAAAIMLPVLLVCDLMGQSRLYPHINWRLFKFILPFGLIGTLIGYLLMRRVAPNTVAGIVGALTLLFLAQRLAFRASKDKPLPRPIGAVLTATTGFTSFVAHAGGPPISFYIIPMQLAPLVYTATMGAFFFVINLSKWVPYAALGLFEWKNFFTSIVLMPLVPFGVWAGMSFASRVRQDTFYNIMYCGMFVAGVKLLYDGLK
jgi:uncharacterized membrane protein YfcA